jgi:arsenate reductase-like glutaredoxin family protein
MTVTIYHNPACGTSRNTLAMIRASGEEPEVIQYLKTPPSRETLVAWPFGQQDIAAELDPMTTATIPGRTELP